MAKVFAPALKQAGAKNISAKELARHLLAVIEGAIITARSHREPKYLNEGLKHFRHYLETILGTR